MLNDALQPPRLWITAFHDVSERLFGLERENSAPIWGFFGCKNGDSFSSFWPLLHAPALLGRRLLGGLGLVSFLGSWISAAASCSRGPLICFVSIAQTLSPPEYRSYFLPLWILYLFSLFFLPFIHYSTFGLLFETTAWLFHYSTTLFYSSAREASAFFDLLVLGLPKPCLASALSLVRNSLGSASFRLLLSGRIEFGSGNGPSCFCASFEFRRQQNKLSLECVKRVGMSSELLAGEESDGSEMELSGVRNLGFFVDPSLDFATIKAACTALAVIPAKGKVVSAQRATDKLYKEFARKSDLYNMEELRLHWVNPKTGDFVEWAPLEAGERVRLRSCKHRPVGIRKGHSGRRKRVGLGPSLSFQSASQVSQAEMADWDESRADVTTEIDKIWEYLNVFRDDLIGVESGLAEVSEIKSGLSAVVEAQTSQAETIASLASSMMDIKRDVSRLGTATEKAAALVASLETKVSTTGTAELANVVKTVEYLDAAERSKSLIVFGWPVNSTDDRGITGLAVASSDAFHFLETVGVTERFELERYSSVRRQPRKDQPDTPMDGSSVSPPPLIISFSDSFKAQAVLQAFLTFSRRPESRNISFRAKINTTPRERELQRQTQPIVNLLRETNIDARYRSGGRIAKYVGGNIFSNWIDRKDWPSLPDPLSSESGVRPVAGAPSGRSAVQGGTFLGTRANQRSSFRPL